MGSLSVSSCRCCMFVSFCIHPAAVSDLYEVCVLVLRCCGCVCCM